MNAKSKVFGLLAAVVLSLSMFGGAMAQNTDSEPVSTQLTGNSNLCAINIYAVGGSFGTWENTGSGYNEVSGSSTQYFYGDLYNNASGCNIVITFGGLVGPGGLISPSSFQANSNVEGVVNPASWGTDATHFGSYYDFNYTLMNVPNYFTSGVYSGSIVATVSNAS